MRRVPVLRASDVMIYRVCEDLTELLIYLMVLFSPWAFGTTQPWSIWIMTVAGCFLGALLAAKLAIRGRKNYRPPRWDQGAAEEGRGKREERRAGQRPISNPLSTLHSPLSKLLAALTVLILAYCLISAVNARSTYRPRELSFEYHHYLSWLPHSFDRGRTWLVFWSYLGLACSFWAVRDWLLGKSTGEERAEHQKTTADRRGSAPLFPARLRRLLWIMAINGALLGLEGIAQRWEGSGRLLFLVKPRVNPAAETQFGPYAYRANAAAFFNLLWPVCLGFWWTLHRSAGFKRSTHHWLLLCTAIMAACPIISTSRGGAMVTAGIAALAMVLLAGAHFLLRQQTEARRRGIVSVAALALCLIGALALGYALGGKALKPRMAQLREGFDDREEMYEAARPMTADYPLFGIGPGAFESVFQLYRASTETYWPAQLHNDWLETRITFGWMGSALLAAAFLTVLLRWFARGGIHGGRRFIILLWLALAGCLVHARFDFPFQIHSIAFLFLVLCAIQFNLSKR